MTNCLDEIETNTDVSLNVTCHNIKVDASNWDIPSKPKQRVQLLMLMILF